MRKTATNQQYDSLIKTSFTVYTRLFSYCLSLAQCPQWYNGYVDNFTQAWANEWQYGLQDRPSTTVE